MRLSRKNVVALLAVATCLFAVLVAVGCVKSDTTSKATVAGAAAKPADYDTRDWDPNGDCLECHVNMTHAKEDDLGAEHLALEGDEALKCIDCHVDSPELKAAHEEEDTEDIAYTVDNSVCLKCHTMEEAAAESADSTDCLDDSGNPINPHTAHAADTSLTPLCITCHSGHDGAADQQGCYDNCHHAQSLETCSSCHRDASVYEQVIEDKGW